MLKKTLIAALALSTGLTLAPAAALAGGFSFGIQTGNGYVTFGNGAPGYHTPEPYVPASMSCWEAKQYLRDYYTQVWTVECNGKIYTFNVKKFNFSPVRTAKVNKWTGNHWVI